jgi:hypothetical protein
MTTRCLAAILAADVVGFSSLMEKNEEGTLAQTRVLHTEIDCPCRWISRKPDHIFHPESLLRPSLDNIGVSLAVTRGRSAPAGSGFREVPR